MGILTWLSSRRSPWAWQPGKPPSAGVLEAAKAALRRAGAKGWAEREAVLQQLAALVDPEAREQGRERAAAAAAAIASDLDLLDTVAEAVAPEARPSQVAVEAAAALATRLAAASASAAACLGASSLVGSLAALLAAPSTQVSPDAKFDVLAFFRQAAARAHIRDAMDDEGAPAAIISTLQGAVDAKDWPLAEEAAWALEMMAGYSRRLTSAIGEARGIEALLPLLCAARRQRPAMQELPRDEEAADAAAAALHALLVLLTDNRRNRGRLRRAGGALELVEAFQDERLGWEAREQAATMLQDMAATLAQDGVAEELMTAAPSGTPATAAIGGPSRTTRLAPAPPQPVTTGSQDLVWRGTLLPALVQLLKQQRGESLQESKEAVAGILAKFAANGPRFAGEVIDTGALTLLLQLLHAGLHLAGGERRTAIAALQALEPLAGEQACRDQLRASCLNASGQLDLLGLLHSALVGATAPELDLAAYYPARSGGGRRKVGAGSGRGGLTLISGGQLVAAGWHAACVAARLCGGAELQLQDEAVRRKLLPLLVPFVLAEPSRAPVAVPGPEPFVAAAAGEAAGVPAAAGAEQAADFMQAVRCEVAALLRSLSMRAEHHAALRNCPGLLHGLKALAQPGAQGWTELKAAARRILQNLGELPNTDRPLLTYTPQELRALLEQLGIQASRFEEMRTTGADFVNLTNIELQQLVPAGQQPRVLRVLRAYDTFSEIDQCGTASSTFGMVKMVAWLSKKGHRQAEVVPLAESLLELMDSDRDDTVSFPDFLQYYDEFVARTHDDLQPASKRRRTEGFTAVV